MSYQNQCTAQALFHQVQTTRQSYQSQCNISNMFYHLFSSILYKQRTQDLVYKDRNSDQFWQISPFSWFHMLLFFIYHEAKVGHLCREALIFKLFVQENLLKQVKLIQIRLVKRVDEAKRGWLVKNCFLLPVCLPSAQVVKPEQQFLPSFYD